MTAGTLRKQFRTARRAITHAYTRALRVRAPLPADAERQAADNYWRMLGHELPAEERAIRHHKFAIDAPYIRSQRPHTTA